jgi:signal transduction histidine kinase
MDDIKKGLMIVEDRSRGMIDFVTRFRNLTLIPQPNPTEVNIKSFFDSIGILLKDELNKHNINFSTIISTNNITAYADRGMLEQIVINLIKKDSADNIFIEINDNGAGIPPELHSKIFIPFFTTRKNGTGIGLSLSRQLANVQGGALTLSKSIAGETIFTLWLKSI